MTAIPRGWGTNFYSRPYARGDRQAYINYRTAQRNFYSRPYKRGDAYSRYSGKFLIISTRAPTRGATLRRAGYSAVQYDFYSRPYKRGDSNFSQNHKLIYMINC